MDSIDEQINQLMVQRQFLKLEINSNYGVSPNYWTTIKDLFERRDNITMELKKLYKLRYRKLKLDKIMEH